MRRFRPALLMTAALVCAGASPRVLAAPAVPPAPGARLANPAPTAQASRAVAAPAVAGSAATAASPAATTPAPTTTAAADPAPASSLLDVIPGSEASTPTAAATATDPDDSDAIAATVNDQSISEYEVRQRLQLFIATSYPGVKLDAEQTKRIRGQILERLEDEKIQLAEALKKHITVSPAEIDKSVNRMVADNHFTIEQLRATLANAGTSEAALRSQILANIAWQKTVEDEYGDRPMVTPEMIDAEMAHYAEGANRAHFQVGEIFLPVDTPEQDAKVLKDAQTIESQLQLGAPFGMLARQFSQKASAATGGDMGWVYDGQLAPEINGALEKLQPGGVSEPIRGIGGYYIVMLRERQEPMGTKIVQAPTGPTNPDGTLPLARFLLPMGGNPSKEEMEQVMKVAGDIRAHTTSCDQLSQFQEKMKGSVYMNMGETKLSDLSPEIQKALVQTHPGDVALPFVSEAGIEIIARCDKRIITQTAYVMPSRKEVEAQLFDQQISALARRYLRDLKRDSNIQVRDEHGTMQLAAKVH